MAGLAAARMQQVWHLVCSCGITYLLLEADRRPVRVGTLLVILMMSLRYAGHLLVCIPYMMVHSLKSV